MVKSYQIMVLIDISKLKNPQNIYKSSFPIFFMKKSLVLISFAFIFLLSVSIVSANFFNRITGKQISDEPIQFTESKPSPKQNFLDNVFDFFGGGESIPIPDDSILPEDGGELIQDGGEFIEDTGLAESCEYLEIEEAVLYPGDVGEKGGILNNRYLDFDEDEILTIDETFSTQLKEGATYLVPIPNQECYWEASYEDGELYMVTVCPVEEEFVE